jgi:CheY-like chemotaxis protein
MPKILIVDDDKDFRKIYSRYLVEDGFEVFEAPEKEQALDSAKHPDVILLDMRMPGMDVPQFIPKLREIHPGAHIVVSSAHDTYFQKQTVKGAEDYFDKADGCQVLSNKLKLILHPRSEAPQAVVSRSEKPKREEDLFSQSQVRDFIHKLAHDLRGPIGKVITISELLSDRLKSVDEKDRDYLVRMNEAGREAKRLIDEWTKKADG